MYVITVMSHQDAYSSFTSEHFHPPPLLLCGRLLYPARTDCEGSGALRGREFVAGGGKGRQLAANLPVWDMGNILAIVSSLALVLVRHSCSSDRVGLNSIRRDQIGNLATRNSG